MSGPHGLEIERKFLVSQPPDPRFLRELGARSIAIEQTYLRPSAAAPVRRVRSVRDGGATRHIYTEKRQLEGITREERERDVDEPTRDALLLEADPDRGTIRKTRWLLPHAGHLLELDVFEAPADLVVLEVELSRADEPIELPDWLGPLNDVTDDAAYLNVELARRVPRG